jgi:hypothetical protein
MKKLMLAVSSALAALAFASTTAIAGDVRHTVRHVSADGTVAVAVARCDGLIGEGGLPSTTPAYTHNFVASIHIEGWYKKAVDQPAEMDTAHYVISGSGTDSAGHAFTVLAIIDKAAGAVGYDFYGFGSAIVRRDDGALARGTATWATPIVFDTFPYNSLVIDATTCRLK